jgi:hypothetical protein
VLALSGVRSPSSAPTSSDTSTSINCSTIQRSDSRKKSACSSRISLATTSSAVILWLSAIVVLLLRRRCGDADDLERRGGRNYFVPSATVLHHAMGRDRKWTDRLPPGSKGSATPAAGQLQRTGLLGVCNPAVQHEH